MAEKVVRAGIIGLGIGRPNGSALAKNPRGRVVAICDIIESKMHDYAKELPQRPKMFTDYRQMLRDREVDAVFVGTPNQLHVPMALDALRAGKHVLCTKPLADCEAAAAKLIPVAEKSGLVNMMSLSSRFGAEVRHVQGLVKKGTFGELYYARARSIRRSGIPDWNLGFVTQGGGAFRDMGVHCLDAAWALLGFPQPISALGVAGAKFGPRGKGFWEFHTPRREYARKFAADDYGGGFIRFAGTSAKTGDIGMQVESFWASHQPEEFQVELFGTEAGARVFPPVVYRTVDGVPHDTTAKIPGNPSPWDAIAAHFIACILDGVECQAPLHHGYLVQRMMEAVLESGKTGKEVRIRR